jgi:hypothetical protein
MIFLNGKRNYTRRLARRIFPISQVATVKGAHVRSYMGSPGNTRTVIPGLFKDEESKKVKHAVKQYTIVYCQKSLMARRAATRSRTSLHQVETLLAITTGNIMLPLRKRTVYLGMSVTNESDVIGPVVFDPWKSAWTMPFGIKKQIFGINRREVGGQTDAEEIDDEVADPDNMLEDIEEDSIPGIAELTVSPGRDKKVVRTDGNMEVVFFHAWPVDLFTEIISSFALKTVIDLTAGPGNCALACLKAKKLYTGCCLTDAHKHHLEQFLITKIFDEMLNEESKFHCLELTKAIAELEVSAGKKRKTDKDSAVEMLKSSSVRGFIGGRWTGTGDSPRPLYGFWKEVRFFKRLTSCQQPSFCLQASTAPAPRPLTKTPTSHEWFCNVRRMTSRRRPRRLARRRPRKTIRRTRMPRRVMQAIATTSEML